MLSRWECGPGGLDLRKNEKSKILLDSPFKRYMSKCIYILTERKAPPHRHKLTRLSPALSGVHILQYLSVCITAKNPTVSIYEDGGVPSVLCKDIYFG